MKTVKYYNSTDPVRQRSGSLCRLAKHCYRTNVVYLI